MGCVGCCGGLGRFCIVLINTILIVVFSLVLILFTVVWIYPDLPLVLDFYEGDVRSEMEKITAVKMADGWHITKCGLFVKLLYVVWAVTGVGLLLSICGCVASCCKYKTCICAYSIIIFILLVAQPIVMILLPIAGAEPVSDTIHGVLKDSFAAYKGMSGGSDDDNGWTFVMWHHSCCGVEGYKLSETFLNGLSSKNSCCPPGKVLTNTCTNSDMYETGCQDVLYDDIMGANGYLKYIPFILGVQFVLVFFGCCMVLKLQLKNQVSEELEERKPPPMPITDKKSPPINAFVIDYRYQ